MIKLTYCLKRRPELSRDEFQRYWRENHAPLVQKHAATLRIRRYVQLHSQASDLNPPLRDSRGAPGEYDGVAELWWDSAEDLRAAAATPEGQLAGRQLVEDERRFIDFANSPLWLGEELTFVER